MDGFLYFYWFKGLPPETGNTLLALAHQFAKGGRFISIFGVENTTGITDALVRGANIPYLVKRYIVLPEERDALLQSRMREPMVATQFGVPPILLPS